MVIIMNVYELIEILYRLPEDAVVMVHHELVGDKHDVQRVEYDEKNSVLILHETN